MSETPISRSHVKWLVTLSAFAVAVALWVSCAGEGVEYSAIEKPLKDSCIPCHDAEKRAERLDSINKLDGALFTKDAFPDSDFPSGLVKKSVQDLIDDSDPPLDGKIDPGTAQRKAWILHEMHELDTLLAEDVPPDYTNQAKFDAFATFGEDGAYEGCEVADKLDLGFKGDAEGMPPIWAAKLFELLDESLEPLEAGDRQNIRDYVDGLLPGGIDSCVPGEDSAS